MSKLANPGFKPELVTVDDAAALARAAVQEFCRCAQEAFVSHGRFCVALSGGNTPRAINSLLATEYGDLAWDKTFIFFGDERNVPPDHPDSNYRMASETLLSRVPLPQRNVFRVNAELPASAAADDYDRQLREFFGVQSGAWPRFDLILLGMGEDGHTASLFPGSAALQEQSRMVVANWVEKFHSYRITFTFPVLNHAAEVLFLVSGEGKSRVLRGILDRAPTDARYPAAKVRPQDGRLLWIVDKAAAQLL